MRGYRRFVAYVYEYRRGKKEENCGYIRVEARDDVCSVEMHLKCVGLPGQIRGEIYGFVRTPQGMEGFLMQECKTQQDSVECSFETQTDQLGGFSVSLPDLGGMVILTEGGAFFGTEWDDHPIVPDRFFVHPESVEEESSVKTEEAMEIESAIAEATEEAGNEEISNDEAGGKEIIAEAEIREEDTAVNKEKNTDTTETAKSTEPEITDCAEQDPDIQASAARELGAAEVPEKEPETTQEQESIILNRADLAVQASAEETEFQPFPDGGITDCRKIQSQDFGCLHPRDRGLKNNRFVSYSYSQFGYLLVGQLPNGRYILGLPGGYDPQERFMAGTFGFPYFKQSPEIELPGIPGGYWYRLINTPNFNQRNRLS